MNRGEAKQTSENYIKGANRNLRIGAHIWYEKFNGWTSIQEITEEIFNKPEDRSVEVIKSEKHRSNNKKWMKLIKPLQLLEKHQWLNRQENGVPEREEIKRGKDIFDETMAENFSILFNKCLW